MWRRFRALCGGFSLLVLAIAGCAGSPTKEAATTKPAPSAQPQLIRVLSKDGTSIAIECAGSGPTLLLVHGGIGDRTRWTPMLPLLSSRFTACAMDRRGHGASGDSRDYSLQKEAEDVAAVVESRPGVVYVLGHSYGGVCVLEAAFQTSRISKLLLYEPPLQDQIDLELVGRIEKSIKDGDRDAAVAMFLREVVRLSPAEVDAMRTRPAWERFIDSIDSHPRQMRALAAYRFDAARVRTLKTPTLLITGSETDIPDVKRAMQSLIATLPDHREVVLQGQQHNAMDGARQMLADAITKFLVEPDHESRSN
jgi:pimeloyl-ACP methyl ester carboxylesterase